MGTKAKSIDGEVLREKPKRSGHANVPTKVHTCRTGRKRNTVLGHGVYHPVRMPAVRIAPPLPAWLGKVNRITRAPARAATVITLITLLMGLSLPINRLAEITSLALLAVFASIHAALIKRADVRREAGVSLVWPILGLSSCCLVILFRLIRYFY